MKRDIILSLKERLSSVERSISDFVTLSNMSSEVQLTDMEIAQIETEQNLTDLEIEVAESES